MTVETGDGLAARIARGWLSNLPQARNDKQKRCVDVWSHIACPRWRVGERRVDAALAHFSRRGAVKVVWRAFDLDPPAPRVRSPEVSYAERLARKYGSYPGDAALATARSRTGR